jgi:hypothetical protein
MSKPVIVFCAAAGLLTVVAVAALGPALNFDYADASEERQQKFLDGVAKGFEAGFKRSARGSAEIERIKSDAVYDTISVDIRFKDPNAEHANGYQVEAFRKSVYTENCRLFASRKLLEAGVKMKLRIKRPSGGILTNLAFDSAACKPYLAA